jgi:hypothetical protein
MGSEWVAVLGTLGGAVVGSGGAWLVQRSERRERRDTRWDEVNRQACAQALAAADRVFRASVTVGALFEELDGEHVQEGDPIPARLEDLRLAENAMRDAQQECVAKVLEVQIVASDQLRTALDRLRTAVSAVCGSSAGDERAREEARDGLSGGMAGVMVIAAAEFGDR